MMLTECEQLPDFTVMSRSTLVQKAWILIYAVQ